ncbi:hypothetical protein GobsT_46960 [Gemmata obscuriglobus]|nr:hypothetical protein GobsT_46960 [Gemmata obscuriglobus]VTS09215.1 unnamed protein product [Gemmata obscuriglobus UQM 2246]
MRSRISRRCQVQRRVRLAALGGSGRHAPHRGSAEPGPPVRPSGAPPTRRAVSRPSGGRHRRTARRRAAPPTHGTTRSTTNPNRRVPMRGWPRSPQARGDEPRPRPPASCGARHAEFTHADHTPSTAARAIMHAMAAEHKAHLHRHDAGCGASRISGRCQVQRRVRLAHVRGSGPHAERHASAEARPPSRPSGAPPTPPAVSRPTAGHPPPHLAAMSRARHRRGPRGAPPTRTTVPSHTGGHAPLHLAATSRAHHRPAPRGALPTRGGTHADNTPRTAARAIERLGVAERTAHLHRPFPGSGASRISGRCQVQRRVRLTDLRGSGRHAPHRGSAEPVPPVRPGGAPPTRCAVSRHIGGHPPPPPAAMSRARHPRAPRGAPPTRTAVSPPAPGHAQPHLAAASRARPDRHHAERHRTDTPCPHPPPAAPTAPRGDEPRHTPTGTTRSPTLGIHLRGPHAHRRTRDRATRVAERTAHLHRHHTVSGASQTRWRCQVQRRVRLAHVRGSGAHAERCASAEARPPVRAGGAPPTPRAVSRHIGGHPPTATRGDEPRPQPIGLGGALPTRTAVSPPAPRPRPTAPRGGEPRPRPPAPRGARCAGVTVADHTPSSAARAFMHARVAEPGAELQAAPLRTVSPCSRGGLSAPAGGSADGRLLPPEGE